MPPGQIRASNPKVPVSMSPMLRLVLALVVLVVLVGGVLLLTVDLQPPTQRIEKIIPNDRFQK